jgi:hypothetical protein
MLVTVGGFLPIFRTVDDFVENFKNDRGSSDASRMSAASQSRASSTVSGSILRDQNGVSVYTYFREVDTPFPLPPRPLLVPPLR